MTWQKLLAREGVDITTISSIDRGCYLFMQELKKEQTEFLFTYFYGKNFTHYVSTDPKEIGRALCKKYFDTPNQLKEYYKEGKILLNKIEEITKKWKQKLEEENTKEILKAYQDFKNQFNEISLFYSMISWFAIEAWQADFEEHLNNMIKRNKLENKQDEILTSVYKPWKDTALNDIQEKMRRGVPAKKIIEEYQFLRSWSAVWYRPLEEAWVQNFKAPENKTELITQKELFALLKPNIEEKKFLELAPYIIFFKDWRDDLRRMHCYSWTFLFEELAREWNVNYEDVGYLTLDEIENALAKKTNSKEIITRRKENTCIVTYSKKEDKIIVIDKNIPEKYNEIIEEIENKGKNEIIKGLVAFKGKIKGKVKLVRSYHDVKNVEIGNILVANTTHPTYLPAMQKAAAFVTNEGGIISHAAIVSREMKKPCIVGTKIATKVLKDGDLIEVDAEKGIVRKLP